MAEAAVVAAVTAYLARKGNSTLKRWLTILGSMGGIFLVWFWVSLVSLEAATNPRLLKLDQPRARPAGSRVLPQVAAPFLRGS